LGVPVYVQGVKSTKYKNLVLGGVSLLFPLPSLRTTNCVGARTMATKSLIVSLFYYAKFGTVNVYRDPPKKS